jgi:hypothetical protein
MNRQTAVIEKLTRILERVNKDIKISLYDYINCLFAENPVPLAFGGHSG